MIIIITTIIIIIISAGWATATSGVADTASA